MSRRNLNLLVAVFWSMMAVGLESTREQGRTRMPGAIAEPAKALVEIEVKGDRAGVEGWFAKCDRMPPELTKALEATKDVPVDSEPVFGFKEELK